MRIHDGRIENHDFSAYRPLYDDADGVTALRAAEIRASTRIVSLRRYEAEMTERSDREIARLPVDEIMWRLELDAVQADDLKKLADKFLERMKKADK